MSAPCILYSVINNINLASASLSSSEGAGEGGLVEGGVGEDHHLPGVTLRDRTILMSGEYDISASVSFFPARADDCR